MMLSKEQEQFLEFVKVGLFPERGARILAHGTPVDWSEVYRLAEEQSVIGLVAAGIDLVQDSWLTISQEWALQFVGQTLQIEQRNKAMNAFVADLIAKLREHDIYAILVKGQGIAQCYEKPLWRVCGDVDLLLSEDNYWKAKAVLGKMADYAERETVKNTKRMHQEYQIGGWIVELHGTMHSDLSRKIDREIAKVQRDVFFGGSVRSWMVHGSSQKVQVFLPGANEDVVFVFTHILQHLFLEGIGLRQICDWCRLLWTYRDKLDYGLLETRIRKMELMSEWKTLYNLASRYLGMPDLGSRLTDVESATPRHSSSKLDSAHGSIADFMVHDSRFDKKADRIMEFVLEVGNFGHNREVEWSNGFKRRIALVWHKIIDTIRLSFIFPVDAPRFLMNYVADGFRGLVTKW